MRNQQTDGLQANLTAEFRFSGQTPVEFLSSFDDLVEGVDQRAIIQAQAVQTKDLIHEVYHQEVVWTSACILDPEEGLIYELYHRSDRPNNIFVKL